MSAFPPNRWPVALSLAVLIYGAPARGQETFDFETFGDLIGQAQVLYDAAQVLPEEDAEQRRSLLVESSEVQVRAVDMLYQAIESGVFAGPDRDEAIGRLLELNASVVVLLVDTGNCDDASDRLERTIAEFRLLPQQDQLRQLEDLRPSVEACEPYVDESDRAGVGSSSAVDPELERTARAEAATAVAESIDEAESQQESVYRSRTITERAEPRHPYRTAAWVTGSVSVACFAAALIYYLRSNSLQRDLDTEVSRPRFDPNDAEAIWSDLEESDRLMNVFLWSGVGLAATTAILATLELTTGHDEQLIVPAAIPGGAFVGLQWRF